MSKTPSRKKYRFSYYSNENYLDETVDLRYGKCFHLLSSERFLQVTDFEQMVELTLSTDIRRSALVP